MAGPRQGWPLVRECAPHFWVQRQGSPRLAPPSSLACILMSAACNSCLRSFNSASSCLRSLILAACALLIRCCGCISSDSIGASPSLRAPHSPWPSARRSRGIDNTPPDPRRSGSAARGHRLTSAQPPEYDSDLVNIPPLLRAAIAAPHSAVLAHAFGQLQPEP